MISRLLAAAAAAALAFASTAFAHDVAIPTQPTLSDPSATSDTVRQVQQLLKEEGLRVEVDGVMGPQTESALRAWQEQEGLEVTGRLDPATLAGLGVRADGMVNGEW